MLGFLRRVLSDCSRHVKSKAYTTLVRPSLSLLAQCGTHILNVIFTKSN